MKIQAAVLRAGDKPYSIEPLEAKQASLAGTVVKPVILPPG